MKCSMDDFVNDAYGDGFGPCYRYRPLLDWQVDYRVRTFRVVVWGEAEYDHEECPYPTNHFSRRQGRYLACSTANEGVELDATSDFKHCFFFRERPTTWISRRVIFPSVNPAKDSVLFLSQVEFAPTMPYRDSLTEFLAEQWTFLICEQPPRTSPSYRKGQ